MANQVISETISHYRIISKVGSGGMGEVYQAEDTRLDRRVALKLLPADFTQDEDRVRRFIQEAKAASALNHPNIITVHDIGESERGRFIVMELVAGRPVRELIVSDNSVETLLALGSQMARALSAAHAAGITHRDIKPDNIMVRDDGYVKVLDFGLARLVPATATGEEAPTLAQQTMPGQLLGTVAYMSPEQARGQSVSYPSDVFALGVVLYELATGRHPFKAETLVGYLHGITLQTPAPLTSLRPEMPAALNDLILRMLEKEPSGRPTAAEVAQVLQEMEHGAGNAPGQLPRSTAGGAQAGAIPGFGGRPAIAVLPLQNRSNDPEQEYFADGLAEDLVTRLSLWRTFPVIARNSSFAYKGKTVDVKQVGVDLGVRYVVEGSVRKAGKRARITARLVDATTGQHVWAKTYNRELSDVFAVQDEISEAIAASLIGDLQHIEHARAMRREPESLEAWELYQRALSLIHRFTREDCLQARVLLERAVALDPQFSTALARLAEVGIWEVMYDWTEDSERALDLSIAQARRSVALDPLDAQARCNLSFALMVAEDSRGAQEEASRAVDLNPSMPFALALHAYHRHIAGHSPEESIDFVQRAIRLSPHDPVEWLFYDVLAGAYLNARRFAEGLEAGRRLIALSPNYYWGYLWSAMNAVGLGRIEEAHAMLSEARRVKPELSFELARKCLGTMAPDVDRRFSEALWQSGLAPQHGISDQAQSNTLKPESANGKQEAVAGAKGDEQTTVIAPIDAEQSTSQHKAQDFVHKPQARSKWWLVGLASLVILVGGFFSYRYFNANKPIESIAVMPFVNESGNVDAEYLSDGMTETLIGSLSRLPKLSVKARSSVFRYKGKDTNPQTIGKELSVQAILNGRVVQRGDRLMLSLELVDVQTENVIWSEQYNRRQADLVTLQSEIARDVSTKLKTKLSGVDEATMARNRTTSPEAYQAYLKGLFYYNQFPRESMAAAVNYFNQAIAFDSNYADAYAGLGLTYTLMSSVLLPPSEAMPKAKEAVLNALARDGSLAEAHRALAEIHVWSDWNFPAAEQEFKRAIELDPNEPNSYSSYAMFLSLTLERFDEAAALSEQALQLAPASLVIRMNAARTSYFARQYDLTIEEANKILELDAESPNAHGWLGRAFLMKGQYERAITELRRATNERSGIGLDQLGQTYAAYAIAGQRSEALKGLAELLALSKRKYVPPLAIAVIYAALGETDRTFEWLEKAYQGRDDGLVHLKTEPLFDSMHHDTRFNELVRRIGLPQ